MRPSCLLVRTRCSLLRRAVSLPSTQDRRYDESVPFPPTDPSQYHSAPGPSSTHAMSPEKRVRLQEFRVGFVVEKVVFRQFHLPPDRPPPLSPVTFPPIYPIEVAVPIRPHLSPGVTRDFLSSGSANEVFVRLSDPRHACHTPVLAVTAVPLK